MSARRGPWILWSVTAAVVLVIVVVAAIVFLPLIEHRGAQQRYDQAEAGWQRSLDAWDAQQERAAEDVPAVEGIIAVSESVTTESALPYLDEALVADVRDLSGPLSQAAQQLSETSVPEPLSLDPETTDELNAAADALAEQAGIYDDANAQYEAALEQLASDAPALETAVTAVRASIPERADALEEANISSTTRSRIQLHYAADAAATSEENIGYYVDAYVEAAKAVEQSQRDEMAEKDQGDGLIDTRLEIEEFVRSITGGVRVDFTWAPLVIGLGEGDSAGGRVSWQYLDGGSATMELSNSIAANWPDPRYESLVAHESGHVITAKCQSMLVDTFDNDAELMATAWAIGMGYTEAWGNGVNFYYDGVAPTTELVEATNTCR